MGIHFFDRGCKDDIGTCRGCKLAVVLKVARIAGVVFLGAKLKRVDKNTNDYQIVFGTGPAD